eukprot:4598596-Prymnesium_polylepis.2
MGARRCRGSDVSPACDSGCGGPPWSGTFCFCNHAETALPVSAPSSGYLVGLPLVNSTSVGSRSSPYRSM